MKRGKLKAVEDRVLGQLLRKLESLKASIRSKVKHPFHIIKNLFHYRKVCYQGLAKNTAQLHRLFALANLVIAKRQLLAINGQVLRLDERRVPESGQKQVENHAGSTTVRDANQNQSGLARPLPASRLRVCRNGALISVSKGYALKLWVYQSMALSPRNLNPSIREALPTQNQVYSAAVRIHVPSSGLVESPIDCTAAALHRRVD